MDEERWDPKQPGSPLREAAEARLGQTEPSTEGNTVEALLHRLQVQQIEREMQNETLRRGEDSHFQSHLECVCMAHEHAASVLRPSIVDISKFDRVRQAYSAGGNERFHRQAGGTRVVVRGTAAMAGAFMMRFFALSPDRRPGAGARSR